MPKGGFSASLKKSAKVDNHAAMAPAKIEIREHVLEAIGAERAHVFDAFAGAGRMFDAVWSKAAGYVGCDVRFFVDGRTAFVADNRRVLRSIDLAPFNVFDLDAYGSPWEQAIIVSARRQVAAGELFGVILTDGSSLKLKLGGPPTALAQIAGLSGSPPATHRYQDKLSNAAIVGLARRLNATVVKRWEAQGRTGAAVKYTGLVLRGIA